MSVSPQSLLWNSVVSFIASELPHDQSLVCNETRYRQIKICFGSTIFVCSPSFCVRNYTKVIYISMIFSPAGPSGLPITLLGGWSGWAVNIFSQIISFTRLDLKSKIKARRLCNQSNDTHYFSIQPYGSRVEEGRGLNPWLL